MVADAPVAAVTRKAKHAIAGLRLMGGAGGAPRDDPADATVVLNDNRVQGPGCALVETRMLEAELPSKPEVVTALARPPWHRSGQL